ncbi:MAG: asparagine synthase (glutamine-hydrolyzing) [Rhodospirillaceae bacterium]|nr:asparagine synthase (glutamine-hydrolyzing) [Rhodospirillaceae bacterium]|tara:strand:+ start:2657 stop:4489 length:1833 start_codon:yes stop_codon:yes gene_type:complete
MCGIAGAISKIDISSERINQTLGLMKNRGPDGSRSEVIIFNNHKIFLLFSRLSIIDLEPRAMQPFSRGALKIITNGELYNHIELRKELNSLGHHFKTKSDTEVMLAAWEQWGESSLDRMEGMWAFALVDIDKQQVTLCRDRFGEKPLYVWETSEAYYFGSEPKYLATLAGIKPNINYEQISRFLVNGYKAIYKRPQTFFQNFGEIAPSNYLTFSDNGSSSRARYWDLKYAPAHMDEKTAVDGVRAHLKNSMKVRLRSDVPVALCLSGGVDSTILSGMAVQDFNENISTFSIIDDDERYNEKENIDAQVSFLGCTNYKIHTSQDNFWDRMSKLIAYHDKPISTLSYYLHSFMSEQISNLGCRVAISGNGADELFAGYYDHYSFWLAEMSSRSNHSKLIADWTNSYGKYVQNPILQNPDVFLHNSAQRDHIYLSAEEFSSWLIEPFCEPFTESRYSDNILRNRMLNELKHETIPVILHEDDRNSMFYSVENRSPYLDRNLAEFLFTVPSRHLIKDGFAKYLLRSAGTGYVSETVLWDKRKKGFNAPIDSLINRKDPQTKDRLLCQSPIFDIVKKEKIERFLHQDMKDNSLSKNLFSFVSVKLFLEHHEGWTV